MYPATLQSIISQCFTVFTEQCNPVWLATSMFLSLLLLRWCFLRLFLQVKRRGAEKHQWSVGNTSLRFWDGADRVAVGTLSTLVKPSQCRPSCHAGTVTLLGLFALYSPLAPVLSHGSVWKKLPEGSTEKQVNEWEWLSWRGTCWVCFFPTWVIGEQLCEEGELQRGEQARL